MGCSLQLPAGVWGRDLRCCVLPTCLALGCCRQRDPHCAGETRQGRSPQDWGTGRQGCRQMPARRGEAACRECELMTGHSACRLAHPWPCTPADVYMPKAHISYRLAHPAASHRLHTLQACTSHRFADPHACRLTHPACTCRLPCPTQATSCSPAPILGTVLMNTSLQKLAKRPHCWPHCSSPRLYHMSRMAAPIVALMSPYLPGRMVVSIAL